jgi:drug/metabolite transporter (DMT)-like permease
MKADISSARAVDRFQVLAAALLFSTGGAAIKACGLTSWQIASFRCGIAAAVILLVLPGARRHWGPRTLLVGTAYAATMICYVVANKLTTAANTIFLQGTAPLYILLLSPWLLRERIRRRDLLFMAVLTAGMVLFFVGEQAVADTAPDPIRGNLIGGLAGLSWGLTIIGLRWLGRETEPGTDPSAAAVACGNLIACAAALPLALPVRAASATDWWIVVFLGVIQIALAYVFLTRGVRRVPALEASLLLLVQPVLEPVWAWLVHGETPGSWAALGGAVIIIATAVNSIIREPKRPSG